MPFDLPLEIVWAIVALVFLIMELSTVNMVTIWFFVASLVCIPFAIYDVSFEMQFCVFSVSSILLIFLLRPLAKKIIKPKDSMSIIGKVCEVVKEVDPISCEGRAMVGSIEWTAKSGTNEKIKPNTLAKIVAIEGVKLILEPLHDE